MAMRYLRVAHAQPHYSRRNSLYLSLSLTVRLYSPLAGAVRGSQNCVCVAVLSCDAFFMSLSSRQCPHHIKASLKNFKLRNLLLSKTKKCFLQNFEKLSELIADESTNVHTKVPYESGICLSFSVCSAYHQSS